jgi:hypothetical protein
MRHDGLPYSASWDSWADGMGQPTYLPTCMLSISPRLASNHCATILGMPQCPWKFDVARMNILGSVVLIRSRESFVTRRGGGGGK